MVSSPQGFSLNIWKSPKVIRRWLGYLLAGGVSLSLAWPIINWLIFDAVFFGTDPQLCRLGDGVPRSGACWPAVWDTLSLLLFGRYPAQEWWRIFVAAGFFAFGLLAFARLRSRLLIRSLSLGLCLVVAVAFFKGTNFLGLVPVPTQEWGGLSLTLVLSIGGIGFGFPLGLVLALGRRSRLPVLRMVCTGYIELIRGVPLITLLFMANYLLPLFLPPNTLSLDELLRAQIAIILFQGAYIAEVVRGGLQAVEQGQYEAAQALGMRYAPMMRLIILPQALRISAPALVSTFIGLIKDTSLVAVIGIFDLLGSARNVPSIPDWVGRDFEPLVFAAAIYFLICIALSRMSRRFETTALVAQRG